MGCTHLTFHDLYGKRAPTFLPLPSKVSRVQRSNLNLDTCGAQQLPHNDLRHVPGPITLQLDYASIDIFDELDELKENTMNVKGTGCSQSPL